MKFSPSFLTENRFLKRVLRFTLLAISLNLVACAPAKYRGWDGGDQYFNDQDHQVSNPKQSNRSEPRHERSQTFGKCHSPYVVRNGDTLGGIAEQCRVDMDALAKLNHLYPPYTLYLKQELQLPHGSGLGKTKPSYSPRVDSNNLKSKPSSGFLWPMKKPYAYQFTRDSAGNNSLVIKAPVGEAIYAVEAGEVVYSGDGIEHYGRLIILKHEDGYLTIYAHNDSLLVKEGETVKKGQLIATVGATGDVKEPQLFFEARYRGRKVDAKPLFHQAFLH